MKELFNILLVLSIFFNLNQLTIAQQNSRWQINEEGGITWQVNPEESHTDHIEMSGFQISGILHYGVDQGELTHDLELIFPMFRTIPNDTHASLSYKFNEPDFPKIKINGAESKNWIHSFTLRGHLKANANPEDSIYVTHTWFPSVDMEAFFQKSEVLNSSSKKIDIEIPRIRFADTTEAGKGVYGAYVISLESTKDGHFTLSPGESLEFSLIFKGRKIADPDYYFNTSYELQKRNQFIENTFESLVLMTPDPVLNQLFDFAKIRATESIYETKGGLMHGPGGGRYYAAIWANDQAEYANPFFPYLGNIAADESAINSFRHFARFMNTEFKPIPSSIISEGTDYWNGAGDRGDMAMIAYGAGRFALAKGDLQIGKELWPLIQWCLEYCRRNLNAEGVVKSDCDELEFRFPAGSANLNTSCLYYDALISASYLASELGYESDAKNYNAQAVQLKEKIGSYFGHEVEGFETYRYYKENDVLRAWIATPMTVGLLDRSAGTIAALFSPSLWTADGLASESGSTTFWDRATLYGLRGAFAAGATEIALKYLTDYSERRLLGEHVPYPVEAYPEGNQRHLSAESALYGRVITEGLFGIRPTGFHSFSMAPKLPESWRFMKLRNIRAYKTLFDIEIGRKKEKIQIRVICNNQKTLEYFIEPNDSIQIDLP